MVEEEILKFTPYILIKTIMIHMYLRISLFKSTISSYYIQRGKFSFYGINDIFLILIPMRLPKTRIILLPNVDVDPVNVFLSVPLFF